MFTFFSQKNYPDLSRQAFVYKSTGSTFLIQINKNKKITCAKLNDKKWSLPQAPHCVHIRAGTKFGDTPMVDTMLSDGLMDAFNNYHMGITGWVGFSLIQFHETVCQIVLKLLTNQFWTFKNIKTSLAPKSRDLFSHVSQLAWMRHLSHF